MLGGGACAALVPYALCSPLYETSKMMRRPGALLNPRFVVSNNGNNTALHIC
jgi:hypothetical protein